MTSNDDDDDDEPSEEMSREELDEAPALRALAASLVHTALYTFQGRGGDEVLAEELSELQRDAVKLLAGARLPAPLAAYGLGHTVGLPRLLGDIEPGPLDMRVELSSGGVRRCWPLWRWLRALGRDEVSEEALRAAITQQISPDKTFSLCLDIVSGAYRAPRSALLLRGDQAGFLISLMEPHRRALHHAIEEHALFLASLPRRDKQRVKAMEHALVLVPLARSAREAGAALDDRYDDVLVNAVMHLDVALGREVLSSIPFPRREPRVLAVVPSQYFSAMYMTLCPTAAVAAHTVRQVVNGGRHLPTERAVEALVGLGPIAIPAIDEALQRGDIDHREVLERAYAALRRDP